MGDGILAPFVLAASAIAPRSSADFGTALWAEVAEGASRLGPEAIVVAGALAVLLLDLAVPRRLSSELAWVAAAVCAASVAVLRGTPSDSRGILFGALASDPFARFFREFFLAGTLVTILLSRSSRALAARRCGEYYFLLLTALFGAMALASSAHFASLFVSLETLSVSTYALAGYFRSDRAGAEAALKYALYGAVASAILAYGLSVWFGLTGSADLRSLARILGASGEAAADRHGALAVLFAATCVFAGLAYKTSLAPMHFWAPDAYQGAPTPVAAFLSVVSKGAGFALALRFFASLTASAEALEEGSPAAAFWRSADWSPVISASAVLAMTLGNLAAFWQTNVKRLLAYSSIAHAGTMAIGLAMVRPGAGNAGVEAVAFYLVAYLAMNFGAFAVVALVEDATGSVELAAYRGLGRRAPALAFALAAFLFSLIGIPPTAGFVAKFQLLLGAIGVGSRLADSGAPLSWQYPALVGAAVLNTVLSAFYYLRIVKAMYLEAGPEVTAAPAAGPLARAPSLPGAIVVASMLALTFYACLRAGRFLAAAAGLSIAP